MRKTVEIRELIKKANEVFAKSADDQTEGRKILQTYLESVLHEAGVYSGFSYLTDDDLVGDNVIPGIRYSDGNPDFEECDNSRVFYFTHSSLIYGGK